MISRLTPNRLKWILPIGALALSIAVIYAGGASAAGGHGHKTEGGHDTGATMEHDNATMEHDKMEAQFKHDMVVEGVKAEFQIMSLASMNMTDPGGATHHVMVTFMDEASGEQIEEAVGRIKIITPSETETVVDLKNYSGTYAANFTVDEPGNYGVICLAKVAGKKPLYKFWYPHQ